MHRLLLPSVAVAYSRYQEIRQRGLVKMSEVWVLKHHISFLRYNIAMVVVTGIHQFVFGMCVRQLRAGIMQGF